MDRIKIPFLICAAATMIFLSGCSLSKSERLYEEGNRLYKEGKYTEACEKYEDAISRNRQNGQFYINYGFALLKAGEYKDAFSNFSNAIVEDRDIDIVKENNKRAARGAGIACFMQEDFEPAAEYFVRALSIDVLEELDGDILYYLIYSRLQVLELYERDSEEFAENVRNIEQECEKLLEYEKESEARLKIMHILSNVYMLSGDYEKAKNTIDECLAKGVSPDTDVYIKLTTCNIMRKSYSEAEVCIYKAEQLDDGTKEAEIELSKIILLEHRGNYEEAYAALSEYLKKYPEDERAMKELDYLQELIGTETD